MMKEIISIINKDVKKKDPRYILNHIYDMGNNYLFSVRTKDDADLLDPYWIFDKSKKVVKPFPFQNHLKVFQEALKHQVY